MSTTRRTVLAIAGTGIMAALGACARRADTGTPGRAGGDHNQADVMFSMMMIPHHEQAVEMADLVPTRSTDAELLTLAENVKKAQQPEIEQMEAWLRDWGQSSMGMDHSGHGGMGGMMSQADMDELEASKGTDFDRNWVAMMIEHHEGALDMAEAVKKDGKHQGTRVLADAIIVGQTKEIAQMKAMLTRYGS
jgi:uncharacterized protein (DUF305 family)